MAEVRVKLVTQAQSEGVERLRGELEANQRGAEALNDALGDTAAAHAEVAAQAEAAREATQAALSDMQRSARDLEGAFAALPRELQQGFREFVASLEQLDIAGAIGRQQRMVGVPPELRQQMHELVRQAAAAASVVPAASVAPPTPPTPPGDAPSAAPGDDDPPPPGRFERGRFTRLTRKASAGLDDLQSSMFEAAADDLTPSRLKDFRRRLNRIQGDLEQAREVGGSEGAERLEALGERFDKLARALDELVAGFNSRRGPRDADPERAERYLRAAARSLSGLDVAVTGLDPATAPRSALVRAQERLLRARAEVGAAEALGGDGRRLETLQEALERLDETLKRNIDAYNASGRGEPIRQPGEQGNLGEVLQNVLRGELGGLIGGGLGRLGPLGKVLGRLGPTGLAVGAAVGAAALGKNLVERWLIDGVAPAQERYKAETDLARQYGIAFREDAQPIDLWRERRSGYSYKHLLELGFTAQDASRVMAQLDLPNAGRMTEPTRDVESVLRMSKATGLDEGEVANATRTLGTMTALERGALGEGLELYKQVMTESIRAGVSQADTLRALLNVTEANFREGRLLTREGLAFQAAFIEQLQGTGNRALQGQAAADAATGVMDFLTGAGDPAMTMLMAPVVEGLSIHDFGLDPVKDAGKIETYERYVAQGATFAAQEMLLSLIPSHRTDLVPELVARVQGAIPNHDLLVETLSRYLNLPRLTVQELAGRDFAGLEGVLAAQRGESLDRDPQAENVLEQRARVATAINRDERENAAYGKFLALGDAAEWLTRDFNELRRAVNRFFGVIGGNAPRGPGGRPVEGPLEPAPAAPTAPPARAPEPPPAPAAPAPEAFTAPREPEPPAREARFAEPAPPPATPTTPPPTAATAPPEVAPAPPTSPPPAALPPVTIPRADLDSTFPDAVAASRRAYEVFADGHEARRPDDVNPRTGAFGWSQVMPGNLTGEARVHGEYGYLVDGSDWDEGFMHTMRGRAWSHRLQGARLDATDPVPDDVGRAGGEALKRWRAGLDDEQREVLDGYLRDLTEHQLASYYGAVRAQGGDHDEAQRRMLAAWYGGQDWLNRDKEVRALSDDNPRYTAPQGAGDEPSIKDYVERALERLQRRDDDETRRPDPAPQRVDVYHHGLEHVRVEGLEARAAQQATAALQSFAQALRGPRSHQGFGS